MTTRLACLLLASTAGVIAATGCGGGTEGTGGVPPPAPAITSTGVMTKGSVILNGIRFDDTTTVVTDDRNRSAAQLANGMVVRLRGRSDDGVNGTAERVDVENEVRATIEMIEPAANPPRFTIAGLTVLVDSQTVFANVANFAALAPGMRVEVHGQRDASGFLRASRVEAVGAGDGRDELRGAVRNLDIANDRFTLNGNVTVNYAGAAFNPGATEAAFADGVIVEVRGTLSGATFNATEVDVEDIEDATFRGSENEKQDVEGFVTGFTVHPGTFQVNGRTVQTTATTRFVGGAPADLLNNVKVEAEGTINAQGVLVASKIEFRQTRVILHGLATGVNVGARTVVVLGQTVRANDLTVIDTRGGNGIRTDLANITAGVDCVEVRAFVEGNDLIAEEIKEPSSCGKELVQARVTAENETTSTLTFFGSLNASLAGTPQFFDINGQVITRAQFFAAVVPAGGGNLGTLVKVKGNSLTAVEEAELED